MKRSFYLILLTILCLASCRHGENAEQEEAPATTTSAPVTPQPIDSTYLIIPGARIGKVELNRPSQYLEEALGKADSSNAAMGKALLFWFYQQPDQPKHYLAAYTEADFGSDNPVPTVKQVQVTLPQFKTKDNISTGMPFSKARQQYKQLKPMAYYQNKAQQRVYIFDDGQQGIAFEVTLPDSLITAITVHEANLAIPANYLPLHPDMTPVSKP